MADWRNVVDPTRGSTAMDEERKAQRELINNQEKLNLDADRT